MLLNYPRTLSNVKCLRLLVKHARQGKAQCEGTSEVNQCLNNLGIESTISKHQIIRNKTTKRYFVHRQKGHKNAMIFSFISLTKF